MTIKDVETLTGMPRANIRFYESEQLIAPEREKNGYRVYSQEDVDALLRIRLLRELGVSLDQIRAFAAGEVHLADCLADRIEQLTAGQLLSERAIQVCRQMLSDGAVFHTLDAKAYLDQLEDELPPAPVSSPEPDSRMKPGIFRRMCARAFDHTLYAIIWELLLLYCFKFIPVIYSSIALRQRSLADALMTVLDTLALMGLIMLFEPLFLHLFGTTPGKWILGIRVTDDSGKKLTYREAAWRSWILLLYGFALFIPILQVVRAVKSWQAARSGDEPEWEWDSQLQLCDKSGLRPAAFALFILMELAVFGLVETIPAIPPNRGDLTRTEYEDNVYHLYRHYGTQANVVLSDAASVDSFYSIRPSEDEYYALPDSSTLATSFYTEDDEGHLTAVRCTGSQSWAPDAGTWRSFQRHLLYMKIIALSYVGAQDGVHTLTGDRRAIEELVANWTQDYTFTYHGVTVTYDVTFSGCEPEGGGSFMIKALEGAEAHSVSYIFTMERAD